MITITELNWGFLEILFLLIIFSVGFIITYLVMPFIIKFMKSKGHVGRDIHKKARPEVAESGGIGMLIGISAASVMMILLFPLFWSEILIFLSTVLLAGAIGLIDDRVKLRSRYKMVLVVIAGSIIFFTNYIGFITIQSPTIPFLGKLRLTIIYPIVAPIIVAVFANTVNMLEGYNGEGSGTCLIAVLFLFICSLIWNSAEGVLFTVITISVLIPFLLYNKFPAKIFPGDVGTLSMGAMLAGIALFGSLEVAVFCALLIHVFNSFYVLNSVKGFLESSEIQEERNDIIMLDDDRIKASDNKDAALTLPRLILARGPLKEPELVKNFYVISIICGFFSIIGTLLMAFTVGTVDLITIIITVIGFSIPMGYLLYKFPRIRGVITLMLVLLIVGVFFMILIKNVLMPIDTMIDLILIQIPLNLIIAFIIAIPGFLVWYMITIKHFWKEIDKIENK